MELVVGNFEMEIEVGNLKYKLKLELYIMNWKLELEIGNGIGYVHNAFYWRGFPILIFYSKMEIWNGNWTWRLKLELETEIGNCNWKSIENQNWKLRLKIQIGNQNWILE